MELIDKKTDRRRRFSRFFARKVISFTVICLFLAFVNYFTSPHYWWVAWVAAGWGLSLLLSLLYYLADCDDEHNYDTCEKQ